MSHRPPLDYSGASRYTNLTERHLRELVYRAQIPYTKCGRLVRFIPDELDEWLRANTRRSA